jgi:hypothetical protein
MQKRWQRPWLVIRKILAGDKEVTPAAPKIRREGEESKYG